MQRPGAKTPLRELELPPWHGWRTKSELQRILRWVQGTLVVPKGFGAGHHVRVADFQRTLIRIILDALATFVSIPAGNGKTTLMAALGLERVCRGDDYVEVDVIATKEEQAARLIDTMLRFVECSPELVPLFAFYRDAGILEYRPTGSRVQAHPAKLSAVQGLNFKLGLVDEVGFVPGALVTALLARLGKQPDARVVGFGTPGVDGGDNMLEALRVQYHEGQLPVGVQFVEYAAAPGCAVEDQEQWRKANPALRAGFLRAEALATQAAVMPEHEFRAYHLGQPIEGSGPWLPHGAWDECDRQEPPADGMPVVLGVWGNYRRQVAVVGATLDGGVFFGWQADQPTDDEVTEVLARAAAQWEVLEIAHKPHIRLGAMGDLHEQGLPVVAWDGSAANDAESTTAFYQAIAERALAHDGDELVAAHVAALTAKVDRHGLPRLVESVAPDVTAALAARCAWWRARALAQDEVTEDLVIY